LTGVTFLGAYFLQAARDSDGGRTTNRRAEVVGVRRRTELVHRCTNKQRTRYIKNNQLLNRQNKNERKYFHLNVVHATVCNKLEMGNVFLFIF